MTGLAIESSQGVGVKIDDRTEHRIELCQSGSDDSLESYCTDVSISRSQSYQDELIEYIIQDSSYPDFRALPITTTTAVVGLNGNGVLEAIYSLLKIKHYDVLPEAKIGRGSRKPSTLPIPAAGEIISARYFGGTRGIFRNQGISFKNSVTIDMSVGDKNVSLKLSPNNIHICGSKSETQTMLATNLLLNNIKEAQRLVDKMKSDMTTVDWFLEVTSQNYLFEDGNLIKIITLPTEIPDNVDRELVDYMLSLTYDFHDHDDYRQLIYWILDISSLYEGAIGFKTLTNSMVNYNYDLGFSIDRFSLNIIFNNDNEIVEGEQKFFSFYYNELFPAVTIQLPSVEKEDRYHIFLVYDSGSVTQSGPGGGSEMEAAYIRFRRLIANNRSSVEIAPCKRKKRVVRKKPLRV